MTQPTSRLAAALTPTGDLAKAIVLMLAAVTLFSFLDASAKYLGTVSGVPVAQIIWLRFLVQFVALVVLVPASGVLSLGDMFRTRRPAWQAVRSLMMSLTTVFNFLALQYLRLDQTVTIMFLSPLLVALIAGPLQGEWVGVPAFHGDFGGLYRNINRRAAGRRRSAPGTPLLLCCNGRLRRICTDYAPHRRG